jgi:hypothetical protein
MYVHIHNKAAIFWVFSHFYSQGAASVEILSRLKVMDDMEVYLCCEMKYLQLIPTGKILKHIISFNGPYSYLKLAKVTYKKKLQNKKKRTTSSRNRTYSFLALPQTGKSLQSLRKEVQALSKEVQL